MSLNIQNKGVEAARALQGSPDWAQLREAVRDLAREKTNASLDAPPELQASACGYARALRDLYIAFESATLTVPQNRVAKPGSLKE